MAIKFKKNPCDIIRITSPFGKRKPPVEGASAWHEGVDLGAETVGKAGDKIYSVADGVIRVNKANSGDVETGYGWYVVIEHDGFCTLYAHLHKKSTLAIGKKVKAGDFIGYMGETGTASGVHLHLGLKDTDYDNFWDREFIDPEPYLIKEGNSVMDFNEAIKILQEKGVINSPDYWVNACSVVKYLPNLLINMANHIK